VGGLMRAEDSYMIGEEAFFYDVGEVDRVRVLKNKSNSHLIMYALEVLEIVKECEIIEPEVVGAKFECRKQRDFSDNGELWSLRDRFRGD
jgi:hypothetical protein